MFRVWNVANDMKGTSSETWLGFWCTYCMSFPYMHTPCPARRCVEEMVWDDGSNLLGNGGRIYLDGNLGYPGCNYGVHTNTGW